MAKLTIIAFRTISLSKKYTCFRFTWWRHFTCSDKYYNPLNTAQSSTEALIKFTTTWISLHTRPFFKQLCFIYIHVVKLLLSIIQNLIRREENIVFIDTVNIIDFYNYYENLGCENYQNFFNFFYNFMSCSYLSNLVFRM